MDWETRRGLENEVWRQRSYQQEPMRHSVVRELPLLDSARQPIHRYDYYVRLLDDSAWRVPVLYGKLPRLPDDTATDAEKGYYALFLMVLFRPHRSPEEFLEQRTDTVSSSQNITPPTSIDAAWGPVHEEFNRWRKAIHKLVEPYNRCQPAVPQPSFNTPEWWACLIDEKLRNYDALMSKHKTCLLYTSPSPRDS